MTELILGICALLMFAVETVLILLVIVETDIGTQKHSAEILLGGACAGFCLLLFLDFAFRREDSVPAPEFQAFLCGLCAAAVLSAGILALFGTVRAWRRFRREMSSFSLKEGLDSFPSGVCWYTSEGRVLLSNRSMNSICRILTGEPLNDAGEFVQCITNGRLRPGCSILRQGDSILAADSNGTVWYFVQSLQEDGSYRLDASDVTKLIALQKQLETENARLKERNARLRLYSESVDQTVKREEQLAVKERIHDEIGKDLLSARRFLAGNEAAPSRELLEEWRTTLRLLKGERKEKEASPVEALLQAAEYLGVRIEMSGEMPSDASLQALITAGARECLTNAVRHAEADTLYIDILSPQNDPKGGRLFVRYTNNGKVPEEGAREGGGLSLLRRRAERMGAEMTVRFRPSFELTLKLSEGTQWHTVY